jgi:putative membrane protein
LIRYKEEVMMWHGDFGWGHMALGGLLWAVLFILLIWILVKALTLQQERRGGHLTGETPLDILKKRYAKGEISKKEFEQMKKYLE